MSGMQGVEQHRMCREFPLIDREWKSEKLHVIKLTRLNGDEFVLNAEQIRFVESRPDTFITLTSNDRLIVKETVDEVVQRSVEYSRSIRSSVGAC